MGRPTRQPTAHPPTSRPPTRPPTNRRLQGRTGPPRAPAPTATMLMVKTRLPSRALGLGYVRLFFAVVFAIEAHDVHGGTWFRTPCPNCRAEPFKVPATAPRPRKKGRFRVAISDRPPSPPWDPLPGCLRSAPEHERASASLQHSPNLRRVCQPSIDSTVDSILMRAPELPRYPV